MPTTFQRQQGAGLIQLLIVIAVLFCFAFVAWKLVPLYVENYAVQRSMASAQENAHVAATDSAARAAQKIRNQILKMFRTNDVRNVQMQNIYIKKVSGAYEIEVRYEVVQPMVGNVSALVTFRNTDKVEIR